MNKTLVLTLVMSLVALPLTGCIENMQDLKERMGQETAATTEPEPVEQASEEAPEVVNQTPEPTKPPVARMTIFGANGALVYKATFEAADESDPVYTTAPVKLQLLSTDSQVLEPGAEIAKVSWSVAGMAMEGAKVEHELSEPGMYPITLRIEDTKGGVDEQNVTLGVAPTPFDVVTTVTTGPVAGVVGEGHGGSATYELSLTIDDKPHKVTSLVFVTKGGVNCDTILEIVTPSGESQGPQDTGSQETISFASGEEGTYTINVTGFACASDGVDVEVTATFVQIVEGLNGGDGHGGHAH